MNSIKPLTKATAAWIAWAERLGNDPLATYLRLVAAALAQPTAPPCLSMHDAPADLVLALLDAGGFIVPGKLEQARAIIANTQPAALGATCHASPEEPK